MPDERALAMRAVGGVIAALAVVDHSPQVVQVVVVLLDGAGNQLTGLGRRERRAFF